MQYGVSYTQSGVSLKTKCNFSLLSYFALHFKLAQILYHCTGTTTQYDQERPPNAITFLYHTYVYMVLAHERDGIFIISNYLTSFCQTTIKSTLSMHWTFLLLHRLEHALIKQTAPLFSVSYTSYPGGKTSMDTDLEIYSYYPKTLNNSVLTFECKCIS